MKHDSASIRKVIAKGIVKDMDEKSLSDYLKLFISNEDKKEYITQLIALKNIKKKKTRQLQKKSCTSLVEILKKELNGISHFELLECKKECEAVLLLSKYDEGTGLISTQITLLGILVAVYAMIFNFIPKVIIVFIEFMACAILFLTISVAILWEVRKIRQERFEYMDFKLQCINEVLAEKENAAKE